MVFFYNISYLSLSLPVWHSLFLKFILKSLVAGTSHWYQTGTSNQRPKTSYQQVTAGTSKSTSPVHNHLNNNILIAKKSIYLVNWF